MNSLYKNVWGKNLKHLNIQLDLISSYRTVSKGEYNNVFRDLKSSPYRHGKKMPGEGEFYGVLYSISGSGELHTFSKVYKLSDNELIFFKHSDVHKISSSSDTWKFNSYYFTIVNFNIFLYNIYKIPFSLDYDKDSQSIIKHLNRDNYYASGIANAIFQKMMFEWHYQMEQKILFDKNNRNPYFEAINDSVLYINQNINSQLTIASIVKNYNISEKHYRNLFKKFIGQSPKQYIICSKLERAAYRLANTVESITEIAYNLSFTSYSYFLTSFKQIYKTSPTQYRNRFNNNLESSAQEIAKK